MLVFRMDTTGLFRYGQRHELRILFPRDKSRLSGSPKVGNGLAKHLLGRSNSHYIRGNHSHSHLGSSPGGCSPKGCGGGSLLSKEVLLNPCGDSDRESKKGGSSPRATPEVPVANGSPSMHETNGHPIPPIRRRRKNSTASLKTRRRQHLDHMTLKVLLEGRFFSHA